MRDEKQTLAETVEQGREWRAKRIKSKKSISPRNIVERTNREKKRDDRMGEVE